ncbi:uncharacterized protein LOC129591245 [Paramacrobiotus metropolitanus]|uniref:uncharacterized protein LOC129591245 n=1 Tax=Paramacrobiotus metropolitanus TaxID=2943436 RepID=UPI00244633CF|nr:uncharacterized protein LOC129591245 [Paramacrobiotus metropolitanus]
MGNSSTAPGYHPSEVKVSILDARNLPLYRKRKGGNYGSSTIVIFSIGDQVVRTLERSTETGNAVYNQSWTFKFTMPEHSPLFIQIKDMELGILGSHEVPFEEIPYSPHRDRKTLFSFVFKPTIASDKLADVTVINSEKQCELLFNARVTQLHFKVNSR